MDNRERELYELSNQIAEQLSSLPDDGHPRQITVTQTGDGTVVMGSQVIINPPAEREIPVHDRPTSWLKDVIIENKRQINAARTRKWFSTPSILMMLVFAFIFVMVGMFLLTKDATLILQSVGVVIQEPTYTIGFATTFCLLAIWFERVRRLEDIIIAESQETIEYINTILRRRKA